MTTLELALLIVSVAAIFLIFVAELLRGHGTGSARLSPPMLVFLRISLGIVFAALGVIGSLLPIMQGWIFFLLAVLVLFPQSKFAIKALDKAEPRMPRMVAWLRRIGIGVHRDERDTMRAE
jgi:hypothetical protein